MSLSNINDTIKSQGLRLLDDAIQESLKAEDMKEIVGKFVARAKEGHVPSAQFLLKLIGADSPPQTVIVNQFHSETINTTSPPCESPKVIDVQNRPIIERVTVCLTASGPSTPEAIAEMAGAEISEVIRCLDDHPNRFSVHGRKYSLTARA